MPTPWWKNSRGELFVITQFIVFGLIALAPRTVPILSEWSPSAQAAGRIIGGFLLFTGAVLAAAGTCNLGRNLTPFICPKDGSVLLEQGAYRLVRHPIYSGRLQVGFGWGLWVHGWLTLSYGLFLFMVFDLKSRREEELLSRVFPDYAVYSSKVKRLIPFIY